VAAFLLVDLQERFKRALESAQEGGRIDTTRFQIDLAFRVQLDQRLEDGLLLLVAVQ
jgi:hypothetical protein